MAEEIPTDTPIEQEVIETPQADIVETEPVSDGGRTNLQNLYEALKSDEVFSEYVPRDGFDSFVKAYKDPKDIANLYNALKDDSVFSEYMPPTLMGAVEYFGLGKPSAVPSPSVSGGSATKGRGVEQPSTLPQKSSEASLDNIQQTMKVYADGQGAFPETLSAADIKELRKQVPGGELPNISDEKVAKMLAGKSPKQVRIASINAIPDIKERKTEQARMYKDFAREKSVENAQLDQNITALTQGLEQIKAEGENLQQQLQNPNIDPQTAVMLSEQLQQTQANYNQAANDYNNELNKYQQNARFIKTMGAGVESNLKGLIPSTILNPRSPSDVMAASAWNSTAPALLKTLGAVIDVLPSPLPTDRNVVSDAIFNLADKVSVDVGKSSPQANVSLMDDVNVYNTSQLLGNLLGSVAMTFGGGAAAGATGAQAAGFSQVYGDVYKQGRDAGLTKAESMFFAMPTGIVAAYLGDKGVESLAGAFSKTSLKSAIKQGAKELAEKRTPQMMMEFGKKVLLNTLEGAGKEGAQEGLEFATEFGSKKLASLKEDVKFKDDLSLEGFGKGLAESVIAGAAGGGLLGPFFGAGRNQAFADVVNKAARDPQAEADFMEQVNASVVANDITPEQKQQMVEMLEKTKQAAATVPPVVESEPARAEATALVLEQQDLQEQIEQTNPAMAKPLNDRLDEVNNRLGEIAEGKNLPQEEATSQTTEEDEDQEEIRLQNETGVANRAYSAAIQSEFNIPMKGEISVKDASKLKIYKDNKAEIERTLKVYGYKLSEIETISFYAGYSSGRPYVQINFNLQTPNNRFSTTSFSTQLDLKPNENIIKLGEETERTREEYYSYNDKRRQAAAAPQTLPEVTNEIANLREQEQAENEAVDPNDEVAKKEIYDKYDEAITPLLEQAKAEIETRRKEDLDKYNSGDITVAGVKAINAKYDAELDALNKPKSEAQAPVAEEAKGEEEQVITLPPEIDSLDDNEIVSIKYETFDEIPESLKSKANKFGGRDVKYRKSILGIPVGKEFTSKTKEGYVVAALGSEIKDAARQTLSSQTEVSPTSEQAPQAFPAQEGAESVEDKFQANPELEQIYRELQDAVNKNIDEQTLRILKANPSEAMIKKAFDILQSKGVIKIDCN